jgi:serine/threonine protein kinase
VAGNPMPITLAIGVSPVLASDERPSDVLRRTGAAVAKARTHEGPSIVIAEHSEPQHDAPSGTYTESLPEGRTLGGNYRLLHEISRGGVGVVYRAEDLGLRRPVAVKVLRPDMARDEHLIDMFRDEATILASLRHPDVVQVYAFGVDEGSVYFVMELVEGESVQEAIERCTRQGHELPLAKVRSVVGKVGSALDALHQAGLLHRDVKPANILLDPFRDRAVLVDVGIARRRGATTSPAGTAGYMAPEVVVDYEGHSAATDVYGLAITMYEMLTLSLPWPRHESPIAMIHVQRGTKPAPASSFRPELGPVDAVLERGFAVAPGDRYQTATAFASALAEALRAIEGPSARATGPVLAVGGGAATPAAPSVDCTMLGIHSHDTNPMLTRGIVFRQVTRVLGTRPTAAWRAELAISEPELAEAISTGTEPLGWIATGRFTSLLNAKLPVELDALEFGNQLGRSAVRATFRRFFPAASATLSPATTLGALPVIWSRYHTWGRVEVSSRTADAASIRISGTPRDRAHCSWMSGMLHQLVLLSGATEVEIEHTHCELRGADACVFNARWLLASDDPRAARPGSSVKP